MEYIACKSCNTVKPETEFHRNPKTSTGRISTCKLCRRDKRRKERGARFMLRLADEKRVVHTNGVTQIELSKGEVAILDTIDYPLVANHSWHCNIAKWGTKYAYAKINNQSVPMHRLILGCDKLVDHVDGNGLNNCRSNLRMANKSENAYNVSKRKGTKHSQFKGVSKDTRNKYKCWRAYITVDKKRIELGSFYTEEEAARAYNKAALHYHGKFALLNTERIDFSSEPKNGI